MVNGVLCFQKWNETIDLDKWAGADAEVIQSIVNCVYQYMTPFLTISRLKVLNINGETLSSEDEEDISNSTDSDDCTESLAAIIKKWDNDESCKER